MVLLGFTAAWRRASVPTRRSPLRVNATTEGVVRPPSALAMTVGSPPSITATTLLVVPRSMPTVLAIGWDPPEGERNCAEPGSGLLARPAPVTSPCTSAPAHAKRRDGQRVGLPRGNRRLRSGARSGTGRDSP